MKSINFETPIPVRVPYTHTHNTYTYIYFMHIISPMKVLIRVCQINNNLYIYKLNRIYIYTLLYVYMYVYYSVVDRFRWA